jgi:hypothetical protein
MDVWNPLQLSSLVWSNVVTSRRTLISRLTVRYALQKLLKWELRGLEYVMAFGKPTGAAVHNLVVFFISR